MMSYNLYAEGDLDLFALSGVAQQLEHIELFPIADDGGMDGVGIALASSQVSDAAFGELDHVISMLLASDAAVFDLMTGERIADSGDLPELHARIGG
jgi:hypothetical protein